MPESPYVKVGEKDKNLPAEKYTFKGLCQSSNMEEFDSTSHPKKGMNVSSHQEQSESLVNKLQEQSSKDKTVFVIPNDTDKNVPKGWIRKQFK